METIYRMKGYTLHLIPTKKFKTMSISLRLQSPLTKETTTLRTLLTFVLISATRKYPSTKAIARFLDENYGATLSSNIGTKGKSHIINISSGFVNEKFLPEKENLLMKQIQLISDLFYDPLFIDDAFDEAIVKQKKKELKERLQANKDDKFSYSLDKLFEYMGHDQILGVSSNGYDDDIDQITAKELYDYMQKCIREDEKHVYVVGDIDENVVNVFQKYLQFPENNNDFPSTYIYQSPRHDLLEMIEIQDVTQSKLNIGYQINCDFLSPQHYAMTVFNALFGGFSQSRLFKIVREENSLCYYVSSSYDAFNGIMVVNAGIDAHDYHKTLELIAKQLKDIQNGNISEEEIAIAKGLLKNALEKTNDEASSMIALSYNRDITHKKETNAEYIQKLLNVQKEEIIAIANQVKIDTVFFLTGKDFHGNN